MSRIPLYTQTSYDWHCKKDQINKPYAVDLNVGTNEYIFGRTTPNNKFIVSTGLINDPRPYGIQMVGGKKKKGGASKPFQPMSTAAIYNEKNYMNNELIYNALSKSAELKGVNGKFLNAMINAENNIVGGAKAKKEMKPKKKVVKSKAKKEMKPKAKKEMKPKAKKEMKPKAKKEMKPKAKKEMKPKKKEMKPKKKEMKPKTKKVMKK